MIFLLLSFAKMITIRSEQQVTAAATAAFVPQQQQPDLPFSDRKTPSGKFLLSRRRRN
jgi:hypothetical protein